MRSTLVLDDRLFRQAKQRAAELGTTVSEVVNQALRESLSKHPIEVPSFRMVTYRGAARRKQRHEPVDFARVLDADDRRSLR